MKIIKSVYHIYMLFADRVAIAAQLHRMLAGIKFYTNELLKVKSVFNLHELKSALFHKLQV